MSLECPACFTTMEYGVTECACGWKLAGRQQQQQPRRDNNLPRSKMVSHFKSAAELAAYELDLHEHRLAVDHHVAARLHELDHVPINRRWAAKIMLRHECGDKTVTPASLEAAKGALHIPETV